MRDRLKSREKFLKEEKERKEKEECIYELDLLIDNALRRAEDGRVCKEKSIKIIIYNT